MMERSFLDNVHVTRQTLRTHQEVTARAAVPLQLSATVGLYELVSFWRTEITSKEQCPQLYTTSSKLKNVLSVFFLFQGLMRVCGVWSRNLQKVCLKGSHEGDVRVSNFSGINPSTRA